MDRQHVDLCVNVSARTVMDQVESKLNDGYRLISVYSCTDLNGASLHHAWLTKSRESTSTKTITRQDVRRAWNRYVKDIGHDETLEFIGFCMELGI